MPKKYDVVAITGTYKQAGEDKARFENVGMVIEKEGKFYLKLNKLAWHDDGHMVNFFNLYVPKDKAQSEKKAEPDFDDSIPF